MTETVLITGCSSGIGRETAHCFLEDGWEVYTTDLDSTNVEALGEAGASVATLDVTDENDAQRVVKRIIDEEGRIDCLVNNAGYAQFGPLEDVPVEKAKDQFEVNVFGPHRLVREVLPHMRERRTGTIVNVSSVGGRLATPGMGVYNGSKFAIEGMTDALRPEAAEFGVNVVLVEPGAVDTDLVDRVSNELEGLERSDAYEARYSILDDLELSTTGAVQPREVAETILNAASQSNPAARYPVGLVARMAVLGRFIPAKLRDMLYRLAVSRVT